MPYRRRIAHLSVIKDIATREAVAWKLAPHLEMSLVLNTIEHLKENTMYTTTLNVMIHSDQGFHYTNP